MKKTNNEKIIFLLFFMFPGILLCGIVLGISINTNREFPISCRDLSYKFDKSRIQCIESVKNPNMSGDWLFNYQLIGDPNLK
jgi:hypothetical protein